MAMKWCVENGVFPDNKVKAMFEVFFKGTLEIY